jgi:protein-tyrosine-phosphatase
MSDGAASGAPFHILVLCTHNRTRSVMIAGLLRKHLGDDPRFVVTSAGFREEGLPALPEAVALLAEQGIDASGHLSRRVTPEIVRSADLILTAEKPQVVAVVAELGGDFDRTFTLLEYVHYSHSSLEGRPRGAVYMRTSVAEVEDPTGRQNAVWRSVFNGLISWSAQAAAALQGS